MRSVGPVPGRGATATEVERGAIRVSGGDDGLAVQLMRLWVTPRLREVVEVRKADPVVTLGGVSGGVMADG